MLRSVIICLIAFRFISHSTAKLVHQHPWDLLLVTGGSPHFLIEKLYWAFVDLHVNRLLKENCMPIEMVTALI